MFGIENFGHFILLKRAVKHLYLSYKKEFPSFQIDSPENSTFYNG